MKYFVYIHTVKKNQKKYVGLTVQNPEKRWKNGKGYKGQKVFYNAILKYGWENISHQVFECDIEAEMKYLERYLIAYYNTTDRRYGYNISTGGENGSGLGKKPIDQYDKQGNFIRTWDSASSIEKELNYRAGDISACANKHRPTAYNFYWCYSGQTPEFKTYGIRRPVYQFDLKGNLIRKFESATEAAKSLGKRGDHIIDCCNGKQPTAFHYYWSYSNDTPKINLYRTIRKVYQFDLEGNKIAEFKNAMDAARSLGKSDNSTILDCCNGKYKTCYGFVWKYEC